MVRLVSKTTQNKTKTKANKKMNNIIKLEDTPLGESVRHFLRGISEG